MKKIIFSSDHNGVFLLKELIAFCVEKGHSAQEFPVGKLDFIDVTVNVIKAVLEDEKNIGILICGSGLGVSIAANRNSQIRAALCRTTEDARLARRQLNANVMCFGSRYTTALVAQQCIDIFLSEPFKEDNHRCCVNKLNSFSFRD